MSAHALRVPVAEPAPKWVVRPTMRLLEYCRERQWAGFDPYDALNSRVLTVTGLTSSKVLRLAATQALKRLPINLRPLLAIAPTVNPKAAAIFLMAFHRLAGAGLLPADDMIASMVSQLVLLRSRETSYWCWGYSFPWQTRTVLVPRGAPNLVCTSFVGEALLETYARSQDALPLEMAVSAANYIVDQLYWTDETGNVGFAYPTPTARQGVHNANFLAASLLCKAASLTGNQRFLDTAMSAARYSASRQREDGSWSYGERSTQAWIDNFHTGYNLCALRSIAQHAGTTEFDATLHRGYDFYRRHFIENGVAKYFHNRTHPIDCHSIAQTVITLLTLKDLDPTAMATATEVITWALANMWDERGCFFYQKLAVGTNRISYMRWTQAWMLLALATYVHESTGFASGDA